MKHYPTIAIALLGLSALAHPVFAQSAAGADPACIIKNADGIETVDNVKCPDGLKPAASATGTDTTAAPVTDATTTQSTTAPAAEAIKSAVIVPPEALSNTRVMTASDFIGKRVFTAGGEDIGEVNDLIVTDNGAVQAVILGVGGFLGIGEKDVAVAMNAIEMQPDGNNVKLVVAASKDELNSAPSYDRTKRTYTN